jgi:hypothetical protein
MPSYSISHNLADITAKQAAHKYHTPHVIGQIHYSYTPKEIELLKTQGTSQHK